VAPLAVDGTRSCERFPKGCSRSWYPSCVGACRRRETHSIHRVLTQLTMPWLTGLWCSLRRRPIACSATNRRRLCTCGAPDGRWHTSGVDEAALEALSMAVPHPRGAYIGPHTHCSRHYSFAMPPLAQPPDVTSAPRSSAECARTRGTARGDCSGRVPFLLLLNREDHQSFATTQRRLVQPLTELPRPPPLPEILQGAHACVGHHYGGRWRAKWQCSRLFEGCSM
jgi:hypothetical protein